MNLCHFAGAGTPVSAVFRYRTYTTPSPAGEASVLSHPPRGVGDKDDRKGPSVHIVIDDWTATARSLSPPQRDKWREGDRYVTYLTVLNHRIVINGAKGDRKVFEV